MDLAPTPARAPSGALCAVHENAQAHGACDRCGNFVCPLCLDPFGPLPGHCAACREREGGGAIAWERDEGSWLARWWQTTRDVVFRPSATFESARPRSAGPAMGYVAVTGVLMGSVLSALLAFVLILVAATGMLGDIGRDSDLGWPIVAGIAVALLLVYPIVCVVGMLLSVCIRGLVYHGAVALVGGNGGIGASFWTVSYLHAVHVTMIPLGVIQQVPIIGPLIGFVGYLAMEVFIAVQLTRAAERYHGLEGGRAALAGWGPFLLALLLAGTCCLGTVMLALADLADR